jgi:catechol 2,3-dioxygenase-like lactoylglutathione lyase family enzyme
MTKLAYVIAFVDEVDATVAFYRDVVGLKLRFQSPEWSEFDTGTTTLALHKASAENPAGTLNLGLQVSDLDAFRARLAAGGVFFTREPAEQHGQRLSEFKAPDGSRVSVSSPVAPPVAAGPKR